MIFLGPVTRMQNESLLLWPGRSRSRVRPAQVPHVPAPRQSDHDQRPVAEENA
jgi:hypothetical protein